MNPMVSVRIATWIMLSGAPFAQETSFPLESVQAKGTALASATVQEIAGLSVGSPINKAGIEEACKRLADSGLFASINYDYAPGPKRVYIVTLSLSDQPAAIPAFVDIPDAEEDDVWRWLGQKYPIFVHRLPKPESAQDYLARQIEEHLAPVLNGQHVAVRLEADLATGRSAAVFQLETPPQISALTFTGVQEFRSDDLAAMLRKAMGAEGFTRRHFETYLDGVVRQAYEEHGMYRVSFGKMVTQKTGAQSLAVTTGITEGQKFNLGEVQVIGENLPRDAMLKAAAFDSGKLANWKDIQQKIFALEIPVKRTGYVEAKARAEKILHDDQHKLDLRVSIIMGPLYHFGQVTFVGLSDSSEANARKMWKMQRGDAYDFRYSSEFFADFAKKVDLRTYKVRLQSQKALGDHVMDEVVTFAPK